LAKKWNIFLKVSGLAKKWKYFESFELGKTMNIFEKSGVGKKMESFLKVSGLVIKWKFFENFEVGKKWKYFESFEIGKTMKIFGIEGVQSGILSYHRYNLQFLKMSDILKHVLLLNKTTDLLLLSPH
jgi:hypothetical protein